jgi:hypothetical protein
MILQRRSAHADCQRRSAGIGSRELMDANFIVRTR